MYLTVPIFFLEKRLEGLHLEDEIKDFYLKKNNLNIRVFNRLRRKF